MNRVIGIFLILMSLTVFISCSSSSGEQGEEVSNQTEEQGLDVNEVGGYGKAITADGALPMEELLMKVGEEGGRYNGKVKGEVTACCQNSGCWMNIAYGDGEEMRVTFKDYGFFVPKDIAGKEVVFEGFAEYDSTSVDMLRHLAEDAGKPAEEIEKITEPKLELVFEAEGVLVL